ncbi:UDP-glycosyltransferase 92A1 [Dichanthelium oligosanthes]|uniref:Glycosyltransferase n=1 Tax=Dichanthelium oligosanthes TaxID=888268 RepID=A0A1E5W887_9POAL|nr:UDP-glycosyltransferase 92A1 [Dichanthelium oligosanthes]
MGSEHEHGGGHLVLFPFLAQGHLIPFLNLAKRLESLGQRGGSGQRRLEVTIISTPRNVASLRRAVPAGSCIGFAELPFSPSDHGLPPDAESTDVVPLSAFPAFFFATELLRPSFEELVTELAGRQGRKNVCVLADIFLGWTAESARALGVQHRVFLTSGAYASAVTFSIWLRPPAFPRPAGPDDEQSLPDFPDVRVRYVEFLNVVVTEDYATNPMLAFLCRMVSLHFRHSGGLVVNTSEEIEQKGLHLIRKLSGLPTFAVGPLIGGRTASDDTARADEDDVCIKFLDSKPAASVLYVSFGSQNTIPASQMLELARGLEASGRPFIWAVRPPAEFDGTEKFRAEWLPDGFEDRAAAAAQGVVVRRWAPQVAILAHASTGAFLSHCGWNSVLESLWHGVPVVGWPLLADQLFDSRMLEKLGVGVEVASGRMFGGLGKGRWEHVRDAVETVLGDGEKARDMRRKAAELKELARAALRAGEDGEVKGSSVLAMERLVDSAFG